MIVIIIILSWINMHIIQQYCIVNFIESLLSQRNRKVSFLIVVFLRL